MSKNLSRYLKLYIGRHLFSIHRFLIVTLLAILTITIAVIATLNYWQIIKQNKSIFQMQLSTSSQILDSLINIKITEDKKNQFSSLLNNSAKETIANFLEENDKKPKNLLIPYKHQMIFQVWDLKKKKLIIKSSNAPSKYLGSSDIKNPFQIITLNKNQWYSYTRNNKGKNIKIIFAINESFHHKINADIFFHDLTILFVVYLAIALFMILIINYSIRPLFRVTQELSMRDVDNLSMLNIRGTPLEIRPLIREINNLFRKVRSSIEREKGFTADAAHELKTPLAALKTQVQVAIKERNDLQRTHILKNIIIGTNRCTHVIEQLLILSHIEPKEILNNAKGFSLTDTVHELMSEIAYSAIEKNVELSLNCGKLDDKTGLPIDKFYMLGNSIMISILLRNLIDNAIRYTPEKGSVSIVISRSESNRKIILNVIDTGPGISEEIRVRIFDRFFRKLGNKESGTGLGLSIVKQVLRLHEAKIKVLSPENGKGTKMQVLFDALLEKDETSNN